MSLGLLTSSRLRCLLVASTVALFAAIAPAQQHLETPRSDGRVTPLLVYPAQNAGSACAPLAVISHGAGGSEYGYRYLAQFMSQSGFTTVVMGHPESDLSALRDDLRAGGLRSGTRALIADPVAEQDRLLDVGAALQWADHVCHAPFRVLLGHSMGAATVMLEAGARNLIGVPSPPAGRDRFDAYVALSPQGPGFLFPDQAWTGIHKPLLILTGTHDQSLQGGAESRQIPWKELPGRPDHCQWMGVIDGATHMNFAGTGFAAEHVDSLATSTITAFLQDLNRHSCAAPPVPAGMTLQAK